MPRPAGTCLVMLSSGIDSSVLLYEQLASGERPVAMTRATKAREVEAAKQIAELTGVPHIILNPREEVQRLFNSATFERMDPEDHLGPGAFPHVCSLADSLAFAALFSIPKVLWGWRRSEMHPLEQPDLFPDYLEYISLHSGLRQCPTIEAPVSSGRRIGYWKRAPSSVFLSTIPSAALRTNPNPAATADAAWNVRSRSGRLATEIVTRTAPHGAVQTF